MPYANDYKLSPESLAKVQAFKETIEPTYNVREVAAILGKSIPTIRKYLASGDLKSTKVRGRLYFTKAQIEAFMRPTQKGEE